MNLEDLRLAVYRSFADTGRALALLQLRDALSSDEVDVRSGLRELSQRKLVVLDEQDQIRMGCLRTAALTRPGEPDVGEYPVPGLFSPIRLECRPR